MAKSPWKPWHEVVTLRDDLKTGDLSCKCSLRTFTRS